MAQENETSNSASVEGDTAAKFTFNALTPEKNIKPLGKYEDAITFARNDNSVRNIAISGSYGSGKSSVIESYETIHEYFKKDSKHISALIFPFGDIKKCPDCQKNGYYRCEKHRDNDLEERIISQLLNSVKSNDIPKSKFSLIREVANQKRIKISTFALIVCLALIFNILGENKYIHQLFGFLGCYSIISSIIYIVLICIAIGLTGCIIYKLVSYVLNRDIKISKIGTKDANVELFDGKNDPLFNKQLDEICYIISKLGKHNFIFEDIDRCEDPLIFAELRELNFLLNEKPMLSELTNKRSTPIKFWYLIRDDILEQKYRTKMFDFIIPVIPVIDPSNVYEAIVKHFPFLINNDKFDKIKLRNIVEYLPDMRLLKNVFNEFEIYNEEFKKIENYNPTKLFAYVLYKNLLPEDFAKMQNSRGLIPWIIDLKSVRENTEKQNIFHFEESGQNETLQQESERKEKLDQSEKILNDIKSINLGSFIQKYINLKIVGTDSKKDVKYKEILNGKYGKLIIYLLNQNLIDKHYHDYISRFIEGNIDKSDKQYLTMVHDSQTPNYSFKMSHPDVLLNEYLSFEDLYSVSALNYNIFETFISGKTSKNKYDAKNMIKTAYQSDINHDFIITLLQREIKNKHLLYKWLYDDFNDIYSDILKSNHEDLSNNLSLDILTKTNIPKSRGTLPLPPDSLSKYFTSDNFPAWDYLKNNLEKYTEDEIENLVSNMNSLDIKVKLVESVPTKPKAKKFYDLIYQQNLYEINVDNISFFLEQFYDGYKLDIEKISLYSLLKSKSEEPIANDLDEKIQSYYEAIFAQYSEIKVTDDLEDVIHILNFGVSQDEEDGKNNEKNNRISDDFKKKYIAHLYTPIDQLDKLTGTDLWTEIARNENAYVHNWQNAVLYYAEFEEFDLLKTVNPDEKFAWKALGEILHENERSDFYKAVLGSDNLTDNIKVQVIEDSMVYFDNMLPAVLENLPSQEVVQCIIDSDLLKVNVSLKFIRSNYEELSGYFIWKNLQKYVDDVMTADIINEYELEYLIGKYNDTNEENKGLITQVCIHFKNIIVRIATQITYTLLNKIYAEAVFTEQQKVDILCNQIPYLDRGYIGEIAKNYLSNYNWIPNILNGKRTPRPNQIVTNTQILKALQSANIVSKYEPSKQQISAYEVYTRKKKNQHKEQSNVQ
ncbi:MAG: hypothetical protein LBM13_03620 [Candidatus Ancillula sp.]|nr:hypothetical protein [Candidatus Ancillula sp.]